MISFQNLNYAYPDQPPLFQDLTLEIGTGKIIGLLGKNGSGKTTLLKLMSGLLYPKTGALQVLGYLPKNRLPSFLEDIFLIPEEFYLPSISIERYIRANSGFYPKFDHKLIKQLQEAFEFSPTQSIHQLSFGQKKKFLITFALATKCRLLLLDEPTNGLDIPSKGVFRKIVAGSLDEEQLVVISTHQVKDVENLIDSIIILDNGQVILNKDLHEVSAQLQFNKRTTLEKPDIIYSEVIPEGYNVVSPRINGDSSIDMELLFNAVTSGKKII